MGKRILYICTNASAGMRHFSVCVLNTMFTCTNVDCYAIVMSDLDNGYREDIPEKYRSRVIFMSAPKGKYQRIVNLLFPISLYNQIKNASEQFHIDTIHCLTEDPYIAVIVKKLKRKFDIYYTVHDLEKHEIQFKNKWHEIWFEWSHRMKVKKLMYIVDKLVTSSKVQYDQLKAKYPNKNIYYHPFPSLLTEAIVDGKDHVSEICNEKNYFLFFGRIEKYKGIDLLYNVFRDSCDLQQEKLVIAGKGDIYFDYQPLTNVILINRFIQDSEVKELFEKAKCVIFPYFSATQSGVFSFCFYFNKKIIASDVPFFREFQDEALVSLFKTSDFTSLERQIVSFLKRNEDINSNSAYERLYGQDILKRSLLKLYNE